MLPISVVIPVYNRSLLIRDAIESILMQSEKPYEIIVIDDHSSDNLELALLPYRSRIIYHRLPARSGVSVARNFGITIANSEYIALLDSDDIFLTDKLKNQYLFTVSGNFLITHSDELWLRSDKWINQGATNKRYGGYIFDKILDKCRVSPSSLIVHKSVFATIGAFDIGLNVCEDYEFILRVAKEYSIGYLRENLIIKRSVSDDQLSKSIRFIESIRLNILEQFRIKYSENLSRDQLMAVDDELERKRSIVKVV